MLNKLEHLKKETITLATFVEHFYSHSHLSSELRQRKDHMFKIHKHCLEHMAQQKVLGSYDWRFINGVLKISTALFRIYTKTEQIHALKRNSEPFHYHLQELITYLEQKLHKSIDAFSYQNKEISIELYEKRAKSKNKIYEAEGFISEEIKERPEFLSQGFKALKTTFLLQEIDDELNEIIENVLYIDGYLHQGPISEKIALKNSMIDYIHEGHLLGDLGRQQ